jgi:hypothetical protein
MILKYFFHLNQTFVNIKFHTYFSIAQPTYMAKSAKITRTLSASKSADKFGVASESAKMA